MDKKQILIKHRLYLLLTPYLKKDDLSPAFYYSDFYSYDKQVSLYTFKDMDDIKLMDNSLELAWREPDFWE